MKRREFLTGVGIGALAAGLSACGRNEAGAETASAAPAVTTRRWQWKMVTTWPPNFPGLGTGANTLARAIGELSGGRIEVRVYAAGELVPAFEVFDAVSRGVAELGHSAGYYWKSKSEAAQIFGAVPFGMNAQEMDGWLYHGGGLELWREVYAPFDIIPAPAGHTGVQMGGWFKREINAISDLEGLKMRIPGLGGEVLQRAGGTPVSLPGGEIFTALQTGNIDATEWVGPDNDLAFGLYQAAKNYYYPGWHEPDATLECLINRKAYEELPGDLQAVVLRACEIAKNQMLAEFTVRNPRALETLVSEHGVQLRPFPPEVLARLRELSTDVMGDLASSDPTVAKVYGAYSEFQQKVSAWHAVSAKAYYVARGQ